MKRYFLFGIIGAVLGWIALTFKDKPLTFDHQETAPDSLSLLGGQSNELGSDFFAHDPSSVVKDVLVRLHTASSAEVKGWLIELAANSTLYSELIAVLVGKLAQFVPEEAIAFLNSRAELLPFLPHAFREWAKSDITSAFLAADESTSHVSRNIDAVFNHLEVQDCDAICQILLEKKADASSFVAVFRKQAEGDPKATLLRMTDLAEQSGMSVNRMGLKVVLADWNERDPEAALKWVSALEDPELRRLAFDPIATTSYKEEGADAFIQVWDQMNSEERSRVNFSNMEVDAENIDGLLEWAGDNIESTVDYGNLVIHAVDSLKEGDHPEKLANLLPQLDVDLSQSKMSSAIREVASAWAAKDPDSMRKWLETLEDPSLRKSMEETYHTHTFTQMIDEDPLASIAYWKGLKESNPDLDIKASRIKFRNLISSIIDLDDHPSALLERLPQEWQAQALEQYADEKGSEDPERTFSLLEELPPGHQRDMLMGNMYAHWASQDPATAAEVANEVEAGSILHQLMTFHLMKAWSRLDNEAAKEWMNHQLGRTQGSGQSANRDLGMDIIASASAYRDPEQAIEWNLSLSRGEERERELGRIIESISRRDPELAREQIDMISAIIPERIQEMENLATSDDPRMRREGEAQLESYRKLSTSMDEHLTKLEEDRSLLEFFSNDKRAELPIIDP